MLLTINVGNKYIGIGVYSRDTLMASYCVNAQTERTSDEYGVLLMQLLLAKRFDLKEVDSAVIAAVDKEVEADIKKSLKDYFRCEAMTTDVAVKDDNKNADDYEAAFNLVELRAFYEKNAPEEKASRGILI